MATTASWTRRAGLVVGLLALLDVAACTKSSPVDEGCTYDGVHHDPGDSFPSSDGCNQCSCAEDGQVACTARACVDGGPSAALSWYRTCGAPVCGPGTDGPTGAAPCTTERAGEPCTQRDTLCDPGLGCGVNLVCSDEDPTMGPGGCPISRARYKRDVEYLDPAERQALADALLATPLARYRLRSESGGARQLGFLIEDVGAQPSVEGDHVNLYGYTSMAVAAVQLHDERLHGLERELAMLRDELLALRARCGADATGAR